MESVQLSDRLKMIARMTSGGGLLVDVGTDHGYLPIALVAGHTYEKAYAVDVNRGPLERAKKNILEAGLAGKILTVQSDGLTGLDQNVEADTITIAGMGSQLMEKIIREGETHVKKANECVVSPQTDWRSFRAFIADSGGRIIDEEMVRDDGKYYLCIRMSYKDGIAPDVCARFDACQLLYGPVLLQKKHAVLREFVLKEISLKETLLHQLEAMEKVRQETKDRLKGEIALAFEAYRRLEL